MSAILTPEGFEDLICNVEDAGLGHTAQALEAHDAALRGRIAELEDKATRMEAAIREWAPELRRVCVRVVAPEKAQPWMWLALLGEARDAADALERALEEEGE